MGLAFLIGLVRILMKNLIALLEIVVLLILKMQKVGTF